MQHFAKLPLVLLLLLLVSFVSSVPLANEMEASADGLSERVKRGYGGHGGFFGGGGGMGGGGGGYGGTCSGGSGCSPGWRTLALIMGKSTKAERMAEEEWTERIMALFSDELNDKMIG
uniref:Glycine-rich protein n=1 Tax=Globodera rostochiensis TaxID=31243 RepID=A0A914I0Z0_GLORO